jgi:hypothetical protein
VNVSAPFIACDDGGMPKPVKKAAKKRAVKPSSDPVTRPRPLMEQHMILAGEADPLEPPIATADIRTYMAALGKKDRKAARTKRRG